MTKTNPVYVRLSDSLLKKLDDYRRGQDSLPSRPEAIRVILEEKLLPNEQSRLSDEAK